MIILQRFSLLLFVIVLVVCTTLFVKEPVSEKTTKQPVIETQTSGSAISGPVITGPAAVETQKVTESQKLPNPARVDVSNYQKEEKPVSRSDEPRIVEKPSLIHNNYYHYNYSEEDLRILYKITQAEAPDEDDKGKILVVNVIMNRVTNPEQFPDTIYEVVFARQQFEPTRNGAFEAANPTDNTKQCVLRALNGEDYSKNALYFKAITAPNGWHESALKLLFVHGGHEFYK